MKIECAAEEWDRHGPGLVTMGVTEVRFTTWPTTDISDIMDAEDCAMASYLVGPVICGKLSRQFPGVRFVIDLPTTGGQVRNKENV